MPMQVHRAVNVQRMGGDSKVCSQSMGRPGTRGGKANHPDQRCAVAMWGLAGLGVYWGGTHLLAL